MISYNYETDFTLPNETSFSTWISLIISSENKNEGEINFIFCNDEYLLKINVEHLNHDFYTDIISFDYSVGNEISGDVFISVERVQENALDYSTDFDSELLRVMSHGILHYCGYKDKTESEAAVMRRKEDEKIKMFHVEQL